jgi:lipoprotein-anchoring transpeptidase ErfK/SrfK
VKIPRAILLLAALAALPAARAADTAAPPSAALPAVETPADETPAFEPRPVENYLEAQIELHRRGFSCGSIDGVRGAQTAAALKAFQHSAGLDETGDLDRATREALLLTEAALGEHTFTAEELASLAPVPDTWVGKSQVERLGYATAIELAGERHRANPKLLRQLNPGVDWEKLLPGAVVKVPNVGTVLVEGTAALLHVRLAERELNVTDPDGKLIAHFPVSIARMVEKRPVGELKITVVIPDPNYTFDPAVFPESAEAQTLDHKLILPPGPNNPVGVAWIGLDRPGYGMHGTPEPEKVGRTESHGCFRLANWDARTLLALVEVGLPVVVEP